MKEFSKNLTKLRTERNISLKELASAVGVRASTVLSWQKGKTKPNINNAIKIARFFEISLSCLLGF